MEYTGRYKNDFLACFNKQNTVTRECCEATLSRLALEDKGASDSETHEFISFTAVVSFNCKNTIVFITIKSTLEAKTIGGTNKQTKHK